MEDTSVREGPAPEAADRQEQGEDLRLVVPPHERLVAIPRPASARRRRVLAIAAALVCLGLLLIPLLLVFLHPAGAPSGGGAAAEQPQGRGGDPKVVEAIVQTARAMALRQEMAQAEKVLREGTNTYPQDQSMRLAYGEFLAIQGRAQESYTQHVKALAIGPRTAEIEFAAGTLASTIGEPERAIEHYTAAALADPTRAKYQLFLGQVQRKLKLNDQANASLSRAVKLDPSLAIGWGTLADIAYEENHTGVARLHIARARGLDPESPLWRLIEARILNRMGDPEGALRLITPLPPAQRYSKVNVRLMRECYALMGRFNEAAEAVIQGCKLDPKDPELPLEAAQALERAGRIIDATQFAHRALTLGNPSAKAIYERLSGQARRGGEN